MKHRKKHSGKDLKFLAVTTCLSAKLHIVCMNKDKDNAYQIEGTTK